MLFLSILHNLSCDFYAQLKLSKANRTDNSSHRSGLLYFLPFVAFVIRDDRLERGNGALDHTVLGLLCGDALHPKSGS